MADNFSSQILRGDLGGALIPDEISQEIIQTLPQSSVLLTRARRVPMSSKKKTQPVLASLPEAYWVSEGGLKQTSKTGWEDVQITAEELAVIVPIPDSVVDDAKINLWDTVKPLIAEAMGKKIDQAGIFGVDKPSTWGNDILAGATAAGTNVASGTGVDLADDIAMIGQKLSEKGFAVNGFASQPGLNWQLARLRDANGQPIYTPVRLPAQRGRQRRVGHHQGHAARGRLDEVRGRRASGHHLQGLRPGRHLRHRGQRGVQPHAAGRAGHARGHARRLRRRQPAHPHRGQGKPVSGRLPHPRRLQEGGRVMTAKQVRFVTNDEPFDNQNVAELAAFDAAGKPVTITGGSAPTVDTLHGATDTGRAVMKATNAAAARSAIGAGTPYALPAAGTAIGGVKKATAVADLASAADTAAIIATVNAVLAAFRASGAMAAPTSADQPSEVQSAASLTPQQ